MASHAEWMRSKMRLISVWRMLTTRSKAWANSCFSSERTLYTVVLGCSSSPFIWRMRLSDDTMKTKKLIDTHIENLSEVFVRAIFLTREVLEKIDRPRQKSNDVRMYDKSGNMVKYLILIRVIYMRKQNYTVWIYRLVACLMYQSNRSFNIPPRATPRTFEFLENFCSNSPLPRPKSCSNAPSLPSFKPWRSRYESVNYGISNYWFT